MRLFCLRPPLLECAEPRPRLEEAAFDFDGLGMKSSRKVSARQRLALDLHPHRREHVPHSGSSLEGFTP